MRKIRLSPKQRVRNLIGNGLSSYAIQARAIAAWLRVRAEFARAAPNGPASLTLDLTRTEIVLPRCFSRRFSLFLFSLFLLFKSYAPQNIPQRVVRFVARVFVHVLVRDGPSHFACPRPCPRGRIFHCKTVEQRPRSGAGEAFDHLQVFRRPAEVR